MKNKQTLSVTFAERISQAWGFVLLAVVIVVGVLLVSLALPAGETNAQAPNAQAEVVVDYGGGPKVVKEVSFTDPVSGLEALQLTGLNIGTVDFGGGFIAICNIEGVGCPATLADCFTCDSQGRSWGYSYWDGKQWQGYMVGAVDTTVTNGGVEGWAYGLFDPQTFAPPFPKLDEAKVIVDYGNDSPVLENDISFPIPVSGLEALQLTGLDVGTVDFGGGFIAICNIEGVGCPATLADCFTCDSQGRSWGYSYWDGNQWQGYMIGAVDSTVTNGGVEGWAYGLFDPQTFAPPFPRWPQEPTAISLISFEVEANDGQATVTWETGTELDHAGFNLYRSASPDGPWVKINSALIAAEGDPIAGASYTFVDTPGRGDFYYKLEDIDFFGVSTMHEPIVVQLGSPIRIPWFRPLLPQF